MNDESAPGADRSGLERTGADWSGLERSGADWSGLKWTEADWSRLERTGVDQARRYVLSLHFHSRGSIAKWSQGQVTAITIAEFPALSYHPRCISITVTTAMTRGESTSCPVTGVV